MLYKEKKASRTGILILMVVAATTIFAISEGVKTYKVEFTENEWAIRLQQLEYVKNSLSNSDLPSRDVKFMNDSIITKFQTEIRNQVIPQLPKAKKDSIPR